VWYEFCEDQHITVSHLIQQRANYLITDFITVTKKKKITSYTLLQAKTAAVFLLEQLNELKDLGKERMVMDFVASVPRTYKAKQKFKPIWDLTILLNHLRLSPPISTLSLRDLIPRVVALLMIFTLARPCEIFKIDPGSARYFDNQNQLAILTHRKTDKGRQLSSLACLRLPEPDAAICPVRHLEEFLSRYRSRLSSSSSSSAPSPTLWCWDNGDRINGTATLCYHTKRLMTQAGIPKEFPCYTIRHATITKAYKLTHGDKMEVNIFTGHSERAATSAKSYLRQTDNWLGYRLATAAPYSTQLVPCINADGKEEQSGSKSEGEGSSSSVPEEDSEDTDDSDSGDHLLPRSVRAGSVPSHNRRKRKHRKNRRHGSASSSSQVPAPQKH
jgi:hypothetical protein